jgi:NAD(P)-dependent dehydrogenase (short-subunit alcohol dehydrogenase family)
VLLQRLLAKSAEDRYRSAADVRASLSGLAASYGAVLPEKVGADASAAWRWPTVAGLAVFIGLVVYLASRASDFVTGTTTRVDGGYAIR